MPKLHTSIENAPNVLEYVDEAGGWAARIDFLLLVFITVLALKARLRWSPKHVGYATKYIWKNAGVVGLLISLGSTLVVDFALFPIQVIGGLRIAQRKKSKCELRTDFLESRIDVLEQRIEQD